MSNQSFSPVSSAPSDYSGRARRRLFLLLGLLAASLSGCSITATIQQLTFKPAAADAGGGTPEELAQLYQDAHQRKDVRRYIETLDSLFSTHRDWVPTSSRTKKEMALLFDFELEAVRLEALPPDTLPEDTVLCYLVRMPHGGPTLSQSIIGLPAVGKLILTGRWPGGKRLELDPGLAVVQAPTAGGDRYFVYRDGRILEEPGALLAKARAERSDGSNHFRAMPLGIDFQTAWDLPGTIKNSRHTKTWEEAVRDLEATRLRLAAEKNGGL